MFRVQAIGTFNESKTVSITALLKGRVHAIMDPNLILYEIVYALSSRYAQSKLHALSSS